MACEMNQGLLSFSITLLYCTPMPPWLEPGGAGPLITSNTRVEPPCSALPLPAPAPAYWMYLVITTSCVWELQHSQVPRQHTCWHRTQIPVGVPCSVGLYRGLLPDTRSSSRSSWLGLQDIQRQRGRGKGRGREKRLRERVADLRSCAGEESQTKFDSRSL